MAFGIDPKGCSHPNLTVAQLVERGTVMVNNADIPRSVVRVCPVRFRGWVAERSKALV